MSTHVSGNTSIHFTNVAGENIPAGEMMVRPIANFNPSPWGTRFLDYIPQDKATQAKRQEEVNKLKEEVRKQLLTIVATNSMEAISFIDTLERLGVAYHFEDEIEEILQKIYDKEKCSGGDDQEKYCDLYHTALKFRIMRQHGFPVSPDVFKKFHDGKGTGYKEYLKSDVRGMLSLYEACFLRVQNEDILEEALAFTTKHLKSSVSNNEYSTAANPALAMEVTRALKRPLHRSLPRMEAARYIPIYETYETHNRILLKFAKLDYNFLQSAHKAELKDHCKWWNGALNFHRRLPFTRDRSSESFFWAAGIYYEPKYYVGRIICTKMCQVITCIDDIYDAYGTVDELELFTVAVERWDRSCIDELPEYMKFAYQGLVLDPYEHFEQLLAERGKSKLIYYAKEGLKALCRAYMKEARWRQQKYVASYEEYIENGLTSSAYPLTIVLAFLGMGDLATEEVFEWASHYPRPFKSTCMILRLLNDIGGYKFAQSRDHVALSIDSYMRQYGVSSDEAYQILLSNEVEDSWKNINQDMLQPTALPLPLLTRMLNLSRVAQVIYGSGEDSFTSLSETLKDEVKSLLVDPIQV